jgi:hypothetical protein
LDVNSDPIFFDYAIFERDNWPTGLRSTAISGRRDYIGPTLNQANNYSFNYRAKSFISLGFETNSLYAKGAITNTLSSFPGGNTYLNSPYNSDINTVYYANGFVISFLAAGINSPMFFNTKPF